ncbi:MAG: 50S ribosomal protein L16 [Candidatus Bathyarchaeota archaeon]|nr:50S ribosomal protein L16 [Candidatus Termiticorpusculum sp.]
MHARNFRHVKNRAYTRKDYARGFPPPKIVKFSMGNTKGDFDFEIQLLSTKRVQIRHSALEAARVATNRILMEKLVNEYLLLIHPYPHIILRENKMIFGAHADRLQQGMRRSFGTAVGTAAKVEVDQPLITVKVKASAAETAKIALKRGSAKLPIHCKMVVTKSPASAAKTQAETKSEDT